MVRETLFRKPLTLSVLTERRVFNPYGLNGLSTCVHLSICLSVLVMAHLISQEAVMERRGGIFSSLLWTKLREILDQNHLFMWNQA